MVGVLPDTQELVVHAEIHESDGDDRYRRGGRQLAQSLQYRSRRRRFIRREHDADRRLQ
jgi:hypothetical protein